MVKLCAITIIDQNEERTEITISNSNLYNGKVNQPLLLISWVDQSLTEISYSCVKKCIDKKINNGFDIVRKGKSIISLNHLSKVDQILYKNFYPKKNKFMKTS